MSTRHVLLAVPFALLGAAASGCQEPESTEPTTGRSSLIVGGTTTSIQAFPGTIHLEFTSGGLCGGTLVADQWALTAAHCLIGQGESRGISAIVVDRDAMSSSSGERIPVTQAIAHSGFSDQVMDNDIALLRLARPTSRAKARLATADEWASVAKIDQPVTVVGWGVTQEGGNVSDLLRQVTVPLASTGLCRDRYGSLGMSITGNMLCAGTATGGRDSCQGDSGGPLYAMINGAPVQIGIVSFGEGCARAGIPGVYTRLVNYHAWLSTTSGGAVVPGAQPTPAPAPPPDPTGDGSPPNTGDDEEDPGDMFPGGSGGDSPPGDTGDAPTTSKGDRASSARPRVATTSSGCVTAGAAPRSASGFAAVAFLAVAWLARRRARRVSP